MEIKIIIKNMQISYPNTPFKKITKHIS